MTGQLMYLLSLSRGTMSSPSHSVAYVSKVSPSLIVRVRSCSLIARIYQLITAACAVPGVQLTPITKDCPMTAVEVVAACVNIERYASVVVVVARPGSDAIQPIFYDDMSMVFEAVRHIRCLCM